MLPWPMPCVFARRIFSFNNWSDSALRVDVSKMRGKGRAEWFQLGLLVNILYFELEGGSPGSLQNLANLRPLFDS
jgi:hypothetical protein